MDTKRTLIWTSLVFIGVCVHFGRSSDIRQETECFLDGSSLNLNCDVGTVISIIWNATFFGRSRCSPHSQCCPEENADCTVPVAESAHFEGFHWETLNACNNSTGCTVPVTHSSDCYPSDYETVTYMCVNASGVISPVTTEAVTGTTEEYSTTSSVVTQNETKFKSSHGTTTARQPIADKSPRTEMYMIEMWVSLSLLMVLVVIALAVAVVCYRSGLVVGQGTKRQDPHNHHGDNATELPTDSEAPCHKENGWDGKKTCSKIYQTPNEVYLEIVPPYTALERQYENTGHLAHTEDYSEVRPIG